MSIQTMKCSTHADAAVALGSEAHAHVLGGGTLLMRAVNEADPAIQKLLQVQDTQYDGLMVQGEHLLMGAATTMADILRHQDCVFLHAAARLVGGPAIRNMATVAGNVFAPSPYGDFACALLALDADVLVAASSQWIPLQQILRDRNSRVRHVLVQLRCRRPLSPAAFRFHKVSRVKPKGLSVMAIAAHLPGAGSGALHDVRIAYGAMADTPVRVPAVEQSLEGRPLDEASITAAMACATEGLSPPTDAIASNWYRQTVAPVHLGRLLRNQLPGNNKRMQAADEHRTGRSYR